MLKSICAFPAPIAFLLWVFFAMLTAMAASVGLTACSESFTDPRDGQSYKVVTIGEGAKAQTWMAENLNFAGVATTESLAAESSCPDGDERNCKKMGRLYTWTEAQNACPEGWRLPNREDFLALLQVATGSAFESDDGLAFAGAASESVLGLAGGKSGDALKSTGGWFKKGNGSDAYGFNALPAGYKRLDGKFNGIGGYAYFWSSSEDPDGAAYYMSLDFSSPAAKLEAFGKGEGRSVRCVRK